MEVKLIYCENNTRKDQIGKAKEILNGVQNCFHFSLEMKKIDVCETKEVNWSVFCKEHSVNDNNYLIYITQKAFDDGWFSHENYRYAIITTHSWEEFFAPPSLSAYLVYQIVFKANLNEEMSLRLGHVKAEGCVFDFCGEKSDIKFGMSTGIICPKCKSILAQFGFEENTMSSVEKMLSYVRAETIGKPNIFDSNQAFVIMKFSDKDENSNAYKYGIESALKELNIKCLRADKRINSGQLLQKVKDFIEKSRFIIAKVDSENLNVYFELGLAMGLDKDVLLISEQDLNLPTDLKNWECLTYTKGDYEELRMKVVRYYKENYYY